MKKIFLVLGLLLSASLFAQESEVKEDRPGTPSEKMTSMRLAAELVKYGYTNKSALSLVSAMQILVDNPSHDWTAKKIETQGDPGQNEGKKGKVTLDFDLLAKDAKSLANGDKDVLKLISSLEAESKGASRGRVNGPGKSYARVYARSSYSFQDRFYAGEVAEVAVFGDGDTDVDLYVYDENGNLVVKDTYYDGDCYVRFYPRWTGYFTIKVVNRGAVYNDFVIVCN